NQGTRGVFKCFRCNLPGHRALDCPIPPLATPHTSQDTPSLRAGRSQPKGWPIPEQSRRLENSLQGEKIAEHPITEQRGFETEEVAGDDPMWISLVVVPHMTEALILGLAWLNKWDPTIKWEGGFRKI
ncbi:hypothetical protein E2320_010605, partial [Naja naja]